MNRKERYQLTKEKNESGMDCEKIIDTKETRNKSIQKTNWRRSLSQNENST